MPHCGSVLPICLSLRPVGSIHISCLTAREQTSAAQIAKASPPYNMKYFYSFLALSFNSIIIFLTEAAQYECSYRRNAHHATAPIPDICRELDAGRDRIKASSSGRNGLRVHTKVALDSGAEGPGFKSQPRRCRVTVFLRQTVYTRHASVRQASKLVVALLRVARVTAGLAGSNGSLSPSL